MSPETRNIFKIKKDSWYRFIDSSVGFVVDALKKDTAQLGSSNV